MTGRQTIAVSALLEASGIRKGVDESNRHLSRLAGGARRLNRIAGAALAGGALVAGLSSVVKSGSEAQQSIGATQSVYGKYAKDVIAKSKQAAGAVGLSANEYRELSNVMGAMLKNTGTPMSKLSGQTDRLVGLGADLAATFGGSTKDAVGALSSLMRGEADPIERYGVSIKQSDVNARLAAKGQDKLSGAARKNAEAAARLDLLYKQTGSSQGQFGRESSTFAGQQQRLAAQFDNLKASIGTRLLPVLTTALTYVNENGPKLVSVLQGGAETVRGFFDRFSTGSGKAGETFAQLKGTVSSIWGSVKSIFTDGVSIVSSLWARFGADIVNYVRNSLSNAMTILRGAFEVIKGLFKVVASVLKGDWRGAWNGIKSIAKGALGVLRGVISQSLNVITTVFRIGWSALKGIVSGAWGAIKGAVSAGVSGAVRLVKALPGRAKAGLGNLKDKLSSAGRDFVAGFIQGIQDKVGDAVDSAKNLASRAVSAVVDELSIFSPSRVLRRLGRYTGDGFVLGLRDRYKMTAAAGRRLADSVLKPVERRYRERLDKINDRIAAAVKKRNDLIADRRAYAANVRDAARSFASLGNLELDAKGATDRRSLTTFLKDRLAQIRGFTSKLAKLRKAGLSKSAYDEIVSQGVEKGLPLANAILAGGKGAVKEVSALQRQIDSASSILGTSTSKTMYKAGIDSALGLINGLKSKRSALRKAALSFAKTLVKGIKDELQIKSPARKTGRLATYSVDGWIKKLDEGRRPAALAARRLSVATLDGFGRPELDGSLRTGGPGGGVTHIHYITINAPVGSSPVDIGRTFDKYLTAYRRSQGKKVPA